MSRRTRVVPERDKKPNIKVKSEKEKPGNNEDSNNIVYLPIVK